MSIGVFCIFGASITYGAWDLEYGGWVNRLRNFLDKRKLSDPKSYLTIYNCGISGDTSTDLLKRFEPECKARFSGAKEYKEPFIVIFSIGINDSQFIHDKNTIKTSENEFRNNIEKLIELAKKFTSRIIFVGLTPVDESKTTPIPWDTNKSYKNEYIKKYNKVIQSTCKKNKLDFVEIFDEFIKGNYKNLLEDGLHPNSEGHQKIFEIVKDFLIKERII